MGGLETDGGTKGSIEGGGTNLMLNPEIDFLLALRGKEGGHQRKLIPLYMIQGPKLLTPNAKI